MRQKITVIGAGSIGVSCARHLAERDYADVVVDDYEEMSGSTIVVVADPDPDTTAIRDRAPDAVVFVATDSVTETCQRVCDATRFPGERVIGLAADGPGDATLVEMVESVLFQRSRRFDCIARHRDDWGRVSVLLGCGGIEDFSE